MFTKKSNGNCPASRYALYSTADGQSKKNILGDCNDDNQATMQRLQAMLHEWLRMENLVVLAGAGCSVSSGGKTMQCIEESILTAVAQCSLSNDARSIVKERQGDTEKNINFEQWLSYLVNISHLQSKAPGLLNPENKDDIKELIRYISKAIYAECALELKTGEDDETSPHLAFLAKLVARDSNLGRAHLFTLNYDTLFEQALEYLGIQYFDGFSGKVNARFDPSVYGLDIYYPGELAEGRVRRFDKLLHLYKLHGSIHWRIEGDDDVYAHHPDIREFEKYAKYREENEAGKAKLLQDNTFPHGQKFGILPTTNKFVQTLNMPYAQLFRSFHARLSAPQTFLMVLGYGFNDAHVTRIIKTALTNPSLVMLIVEPDPNASIIDKILEYDNLGKRIFILTTKEAGDSNQGEKKYEFATFKDFALDIMPNTEWFSDFQKIRKIEKQLQNTPLHPHD